MTKFLKSLGILMLMLTVFTTFSCSDNDDNTPAWHSLAGEYTGWTSGKFAYSPTPIATDNEKITIAVNDGKMSLQLVSNQWGTATVAEVTVVENGGSYRLTGNGSATLSMHGGAGSQYDCTLDGTISKDRKTADITIAYPAVMGGTTVTFTLGEAPAAKLVAGSYSGWTKGDCAYFKNRTQNGEKLAIAANEDGTADITLTSEMWGATTIQAVKVEKTDNGFTFSGTGKFTMGMNGSSSQYDCTLAGTMNADKDTYSITFSMPAVMGGLDITFAQGDAPSAE